MPLGPQPKRTALYAAVAAALISVPAHAQHQVFECFFEAPVSQVEYTVSIFKDQLEKKLTNLDAANTATQSPVSFLLRTIAWMYAEIRVTMTTLANA